MATPILNADLRLRIQAIHEQLANAETAAKSLLILKERALVVSALEDGLDAFDGIYRATLEAIALIDITLRSFEKERAS